MKKSRFFWQTYKETPSDAETISHQLLLRAGLIFKEGQGLYAFLPMGLRVLKKIEQITREEMNKAHCQELQVPVVTPSELWKETGRFESMKDLMLKAQDRGEREVCISPTNEEAVVDIFRKTVSSYRDLPLNLYQINTKFRDEIRPRFGLMRAREFLMKDGYSFHLSKECLDKEYQNMFSAYSAVFKRAGLEFIAVEADGGAIAGGGARTHEFQVIADSGEDFIVQCTGCGYAANVERAETKRTELAFKKNQEDLKKVETKNTPTIVAVSEFLGLPQYQCLKALIYTALWGNKEKHFLIMMLGDDELSELKLKNRLKADHVKPATEQVLQALNLPKGYIGPYQLGNRDIKVFYDKNINLEEAYSIGALENNFHYVGFIPKTHAPEFISSVEDLRTSQAGDICLSCGEKVILRKGIEVGHIFQLGDKYTKAMKVTVLDNTGKAVTPIMGTYGIGVSRVMAAAIEQNHDKDGIVWPKSLAPFQIYFAVVAKNPEFRKSAEEIYDLLVKAGFDVFYDDRDIAPGIMFKDADLIGLPLRIVMGERDYLQDECLEVKERKSAKIHKIKKEELIFTLKNIWDKL